MSDNQGAPSQELPPSELFDKARAAVAAVRGRGRRGDGTAGEGNTIAMKHGLHSKQLLSLPDVRAWLDDRVAAITADMGGERELSALQHAAIREAAVVTLILAALSDELLRGGVLTPKGRKRAAASLYLETVDRFIRLSKTVGLERRSKRVDLAKAFAEQTHG